MKKRVLGIVILILGIALLAATLSAEGLLDELLHDMDPQNLASQDAKMLKARDRVLSSLDAGDKDKALRNLDKYLETYGKVLTVSTATQLELFAFRRSPVLMAVAAFLMALGTALFVLGMKKWQGLHQVARYGIFIAALYAGVYIAENLAGTSSMLAMVLKKGVIYALIAVSMNLLNGFTGLFSLGQAGFMLVGAYTYAIFSIPVADRAQVYQYYAGGIIQFQLPVLVAILLGGMAAAFFAWLVGMPVLRLKSDYLAIATLGFAEIIRALFQYDGFGPITNGSNLLRRFPTFDSVLFPFAVVGVSVLLIVLLIHSTYGRAFKAIRDDEVAAEAMGINLFHHKQQAFVISSFFAGIGGALLAMYQTTVQASAFKSSMTYEILLIVVIGGMGSISGSVIASFLFIAASEWWLRFLDSPLVIGTFQVPLLRSGFRMVVFSIVIMLVVLKYRQGIMGDRELNLAGLFKSRRKREEKHG